MSVQDKMNREKPIRARTWFDNGYTAALYGISREMAPSARDEYSGERRRCWLLGWDSVDQKFRGTGGVVGEKGELMCDVAPDTLRHNRERAEKATQRAKIRT